jgi:WD40 repeat protein
VLERLAWLMSLGWIVLSGAATADTPFQIGTVVVLSYSSNGSLLAAADAVRNLAVFRVEDGSLAPGFGPRKLDSRILALRFSPDDKSLAVATASAMLLFDVTSGEETKSIPLSTTAAAINADTNLVAFPDGDNVTVLYTGSGQGVHTFSTGLGFPETLAFSPDGRTLAVGAQETIMTLGAPSPHGVPSGDLELFELSSGRRQVLKALSAWFSSIGFSADSSRVAAITFDHTAGAAVNEYKNTVLNVWDIKSSDTILQVALPEDTSLYSYLAFLDNPGSIIATSGASWGGDIAIIDTNNGKVTHAGPFDIPAIFSAALAPSGKTLAAGMLKGVQLREIPSRRLIASLGTTALSGQKR